MHVLSSFISHLPGTINKSAQSIAFMVHWEQSPVLQQFSHADPLCCLSRRKNVPTGEGWSTWWNAAPTASSVLALIQEGRACFSSTPYRTYLVMVSQVIHCVIHYNTTFLERCKQIWMYTEIPSLLIKLVISFLNSLTIQFTKFSSQWKELFQFQNGTEMTWL